MPFELQGHRGARGLKPENTLPSFEAALDIGVSSIETDVHLTRDGVPVLCHDPELHDGIASLLPGQAEPVSRAISQLTLEEVRRLKVEGNPDPVRFPAQNCVETPMAHWLSLILSMHPFAVPTLDDLLNFVDFCSEDGKLFEANAKRRDCARKVLIDVELKRVPFEPQTIGDAFDGSKPGLFERRVLECLRRSGLIRRCRVRSFDHRSLRAVRKQEPHLETAVLIAGTRPPFPEELANHAQAKLYCPDYRFVDEELVRRLHDNSLRVIPWTVNRPEDWERLIAWGVDGLTTDHPDELAAWLKRNGIDIW